MLVRTVSFPALISAFFITGEVAGRFISGFVTVSVGAGFGTGIEKMLKHYGIDKSQAMAFGDGNNDIEMLKAVGNGIAMANASDDLKAVADEICGDVSEDGIYHYCLEKRLI